MHLDQYRDPAAIQIIQTASYSGEDALPKLVHPDPPNL